MSVSIKTGISWNIIFNNTGIDWTKLQYEIKKYAENTVLHCITSKYYESQSAPIQCIIDGVEIKMYTRINPEKLNLEVIAIKVEDVPDYDFEGITIARVSIP